MCRRLGSFPNGNGLNSIFAKSSGSHSTVEGPVKQVHLRTIDWTWIVLGTQTQTECTPPMPTRLRAPVISTSKNSALVLPHRNTAARKPIKNELITAITALSHVEDLVHDCHECPHSVRESPEHRVGEANIVAGRWTPVTGDVARHHLGKRKRYQG